MQRRAAEESLTDHGKDNSNGRAHVGDAIRHKPGILGFLRQIGFMGATGQTLAICCAVILGTRPAIAQIDTGDLDPESFGYWLDPQFAVDVRAYESVYGTRVVVSLDGVYEGESPPFSRVETCHARLGCTYTLRRYATLDALIAAEGDDARWRFNSWHHNNDGMGWKAYTPSREIFATYTGNVAGYHTRHGEQTGGIRLNSPLTKSALDASGLV